MTYERFEQLPVWQAAIELALSVFALMEDQAFARKGDLRSQLNRAALSVSNNIAEGFERGSTAELLSFLYIARGSAGEVRSMLCFAERLPDAVHLQSQISNLKLQSESCSRQLRAWADSLQNSPVKGQRHLNNETRQRDGARKRSDAFLEKIRSMVPRPWERDQPKSPDQSAHESQKFEISNLKFQISNFKSIPHAHHHLPQLHHRTPRCGVHDWQVHRPRHQAGRAPAA